MIIPRSATAKLKCRKSCGFFLSGLFLIMVAITDIFPTLAMNPKVKTKINL